MNELVTATVGKSRVHAYVVGVVVVLAAALSATIWFHPTLGYGQSGILEGADLRGGLLVLLWLLTTAFVLGSTAILSLVRKPGPAARHAIAYTAGIAAAFACLPLIDKFV